MTADLWARCAECNRWFFVGSAVVSDPYCPVCDREPAEIVDRNVDVARPEGSKATTPLTKMDLTWAPPRVDVCLG
jgi:hypothetical protein